MIIGIYLKMKKKYFFIFKKNLFSLGNKLDKEPDRKVNFFKKEKLLFE